MYLLWNEIIDLGVRNSVEDSEPSYILHIQERCSIVTEDFLVEN